MAFTETKMFETVMGNKIFGCMRLTADGSDTTWSAPLDTIDAMWVQPYFGTGVTGVSIWEYTWSGNDITFKATLTSGETVDVFYLGV